MVSRRQRRFILAFVLCFGLATTGCKKTSGDTDAATDSKELDAQAPGICDQSPNELFTKRVAPVLADDRPKSCNECHLSGVDLSLFVRDSPCETMACMQEQELVNFDDPDSSLVLAWIARAHPSSELITQDILDEEYSAFKAWIEYSAECQASVCAGVMCSKGDPDPFCPVSQEPAANTSPEMFDPGGCGEEDLQSLFQDTVYATRGRCYPCHFDNEANAPPEAPKWVSTKLSCENAALDTMLNLINSGYLDLDNPDQSLIILKPLAEDEGGLPHGGHDKITKENDRVYEYLTYWIQRYADCQTGTSDGGTGQTSDGGAR